MRWRFLLVTCLATAAVSVTAAPATHVVVLKDGRRIASRTIPIIAFGQANYVGADGRQVILKALDVDIVATRADPSNVRAPVKDATVSLVDMPAAPPLPEVSATSPPVRASAPQAVGEGGGIGLGLGGLERRPPVPTSPQWPSASDYTMAPHHPPPTAAGGAPAAVPAGPTVAKHP